MISLLPLVAALVARWWFGLRVLAVEGGRACRCERDRWLPLASGESVIAETVTATAAELGAQLRRMALDEWRTRDPKAAGSREGGRRFGMAVPPLAAMVAVMAVIVAKIPALGGIAAVLAATAIACVLGLLSLPPELRAIMITSKRIRDSRSFTKRDEEDAVISCAMALAWKESLPPVLGLIQR